MKKALSVLIAGCVVAGLAATPASFGNQFSAISMVEASPTVAVVAGTVKDDRGAPLSGALVALIEFKPRGRELKSVRTNAQGKFSAGIAPGIYRLRATAEGFIAGLTRVNIDRPVRVNHDFALKRDDTLVQRRGDSEDYRWVARSVPRHAINLRERQTEDTIDLSNDNRDNATSPRQSFHGTAQFIAAGSSSRNGYPDANFFGTNFAIAGSLGGNFEMALIGQRGAGLLAPQRLSAIATMRPSERTQVTANHQLRPGRVGQQIGTRFEWNGRFLYSIESNGDDDAKRIAGQWMSTLRQPPNPNRWINFPVSTTADLAGFPTAAGDLRIRLFAFSGFRSAPTRQHSAALRQFNIRRLRASANERGNHARLRPSAPIA